MRIQTPTLQIESWSVDRLIPYARNARTHSEIQVKQIAASIAEFGFNNPVLADPDGGIIAGHGRILAAQALGLSHVPVIVLCHLTENQKRAFRLADNKLALNAGWDLDLLRPTPATSEPAVPLCRHPSNPYPHVQHPGKPPPKPSPY
jgi:ParB-like chromosome segregation protein Spo0J